MATPATFKKIEERKKLAQQRKEMSNDLQPLSSLSGSSSITATLQSKPLNLSGGYMNYRAPKKIDFASDSPSGRQYTSFEQTTNVNKPRYQNQKQPRKPWNPAKLPQQITMSIPDGIKTDDYIIKPDNIICFNGQENFLSSLYPTSIVIESNEYKSVEHYYQACKVFTLGGSEYALQLHDIDSPLRAKVRAKQILFELGVTSQRIDEWKQTHGVIMYNHAIVHKFLQNLELRQKLLDTGDAILAHTYERDSFYACGMSAEQIKEWGKAKDGQTIKYPSECNFDNIPYIPLTGKGKNITGVLNMKVRKQLKEKAGENEGRGKEANSTDPILPDISALNLISLCAANEDDADAKENERGTSTADY